MADYSYELLSNQIYGFIDEKHRLGYRYSGADGVLRNFQKYLMDNELPPILSETSVMNWVDASKSSKNRNEKITLIRQFALYLNRMEENAYIIPTTYRSLEHNDFCPYIYSDKELVTLFRLADKYGRVGKIPFSEKSFPLILRMLYSCGLRLSEALSLKFEYVNLNDGIITIKDTKFFKDRLVPMHKNLTNRCCEYVEKSIMLISSNDYFFPSGKAERISNSTYYHYFRNLLELSGIRKKNTVGRGARIHDLRHTFAVHNLKKLDSEGYDMNTILPILATYMGHTTYIGTGTYLHLTAELYPQIIDAVEKAHANLLPSGGLHDE